MALKLNPDAEGLSISAQIISDVLSWTGLYVILFKHAVYQ